MAPLVAVLLTTFVFQSYEVDGQSMETTLQSQDRLIVWKLPRTFARITNNQILPERGEIVIFVKHGIAQFGEPADKQLIKRVIALPGERIVVRDGKITIYNSEHTEGFSPDTDGTYEVIDDFTSGTIDMTIPEGHVFVAGDNRGNSLDSRAFGPVSTDDIVGSLAFRIFPFNKAKSF